VSIRPAQVGRHALTKNLALELAPANIRVNTVALAFVEAPAYRPSVTGRNQAGGGCVSLQA
jgi:NAD(P)-dependent dehydrogenase (short-subunit alcohol dehydrogenase family)